jgi:hypothetical protein
MLGIRLTPQFGRFDGGLLLLLFEQRAFFHCFQNLFIPIVP